MVKYRVEEVKLAWTDNGENMWRVYVSDIDNENYWTMLTWAIDELDAYKKALEKLEEQTNDHRL